MADGSQSMRIQALSVAGAIDRETDGATRNITVRATSADTSYTDQIFTIAISDVNEAAVTTPVDNDSTATCCGKCRDRHGCGNHYTGV
ncbi:MAG: hypothetical protein U0936_16395 [Planctomycetaceae bacterium]